jgi:hypothetical protein
MREMNDHPTEHADERPKDDRRTTVNPAENPMPQSPAPDPESVRRSEETWQSVTSK